MSDPQKGGDPDAHFKVVSLFHDPNENSDTMAWIPKGAAQRLAVGVSHFDGRAKRNASILRYWDNYLRATRSEEGQGSKQMAAVAQQRVAGPANVMDGILGAATGQDGAHEDAHAPQEPVMATNGNGSYS